MSTMGAEVVCEYNLRGHRYLLYGCYSEDTPEGEFDFYDLYDDGRICLNTGNPFDSVPTLAEIEDYLESLREARLP